MLSIFSVSTGMMGVCLTGIGLLQVVSSVRRVATICDELLACDAFFFLTCGLLVFLSFRLAREDLKRRFRKVADFMFFVGLLMMAVICVLITMAFV